MMLPVVAGSTLAMSSPSGADPATCIPGVGEQIAAVFNDNPAMQANSALVGTVLEYIVIVSVQPAPDGCDFSAGTLTLTTPDGVVHTLATGVTLAAGTQVTYDTNNNTGDTNVISPFTYTVNPADIGATNGDPGGLFLPPGHIDVWSSISGNSGLATGASSADFYTAVLFQPSLTTTEVTASPQVAPASFTDSSTLSSLNLPATAGGSVAYNLYAGTDGSACNGSPVQTVTETVVGGVVPNATFTGVAAGNYEIQAVYSGDPATFNLGATSACGTEAFTVNAQPTLTTTEISPTPQTGPVSFTDSATLTGLNDAASAAGSVAYNLYAGNSSSVCTGTPLQTVTKTVAAGVVPNATFTAVPAGNYEIQAVYSGDAATLNLGASSACSSEAFTINAQPTLTTTEVTSSPQLAPASFTDSATLTGLNLAGSTAGTVAYNLYAGNSGSVCTGTPLQSLTKTVAGGVVPNATFTAVAGGNYEIQAVYSGDPSTFNLSASSACGTEAFTVNAQPTLTTTEVTASPQVAPASFTDSSTLTGLNSAGTAAGSVAYNLYSGNSASVCTGTPVQTLTKTVAGGVVPNATFTGLAAGNYEIQAVYSGDPSTFNLGASSACGTEAFTVNAQPTLTTTEVTASPQVAPASFTDSSTLSGLNHAASAAGSVAYNLYAGNSGSVCTGTPLSTLTKTVAGGVVPNATFTGLAAGNYEIQAVYSGDPSTFNLGASSACGTEAFTVNAQPALTTTEISPTPQTGPVSFTDSATLTGLNHAASAAGSVAYNLYAGNSSSVCTGTPLQTVTETVAAGVVPNATFTAVTAGNYEIQAVYSGDAATLNLGASSTCSAEAFTINSQPVLTTTEVTSSPQVAPASFTDSATLTGLNLAGTAAGTVVYNLYAGNSGSVCTGTPLQSLTKSVAAGAVPNATFTALAGGNYEIQAVYSGDPSTFNLGASSACGSEGFTVNAQPTLITTEVTSSPQVAPASFTDAATLTGLHSAASAAGSVAYNLYAGNSGSVCTGTPVQTVTETVAAGVVPNATFTALAAGNYEIQAVYSGDPSTFNLGASSACGSEGFTVNAQPALTTTEVTSSPQVAPASFTDSATLTGLHSAGSAAGSVAYNLYAGNSGSVCTGTPLSTLIKTVAGGVVPNATFTALAAGNYEIQAVYSGDPSTFNLAASSACGTEGFTVNAQSGLTTTEVTASPQVAPASFTDSATLTGLHSAASAAGSVAYNLYSGNSGSVCTGTPLSTLTKTVAGGVVPNATFTALAAGNYEIQAVYSGDPSTFNLAASSACGTEGFTVNAQPTLTTTEVTSSPQVAPASFTDSATLTGLHSAGTAAGSVAYNLYVGNSGSVCTGTPVQTLTKTVAGGVVPDATFTGLAAGNYEIQAVYSGDAASLNLGVSSTCGSEGFTVNAQPTLTTTEVTASPQVAVASFTDSAALTGLNNAGTAAGSVAYNLYSGNSGTVCTGTPVQTVTETVASGVVPNATFTALAAGNYEIQAVYSGDPSTFNLGASSVCGTEGFTVNAANPAIALTKSANVSSFDAPGVLVTYSYLVTNTGNVTLNPVVVTDPMVGLSALSCPDTSLDPQGTETCTATYTTTQADVDAGGITNTGTATGKPPVGPNVTATSTVMIPANQTPAIALVKSANVSSFDAPGILVTYSYLVTNTGNVTLNPVIVTDPMVGLSALSCPDNSLAPTGTETCTATYTTTQADVDAGGITNIGTATGTPPSGPPVVATSTVTIPAGQTPAITLVKSASVTQYGGPGLPITYSYLVTNTGNVTLNPVVVTDPMVGLSAISCPDTALVPTGTETCTATYTTTAADVTAGHIDNTGTATGTPPSGPPVTATSSVSIPGVGGGPSGGGAVTILKQVCGSTVAADCMAGGAGPWVSTTTIPSGSTAYWKITVSNPGTTTVTGIVLSDPLTASCASAAGTFNLAGGASMSFYCSSANVTTGFTNVVSVTFPGQSGPPPSSGASVAVTVAAAVILTSSTPAMPALAFTGIDSLGLKAGGGFLLILLGTGLTWFSRRRGRHAALLRAARR
jgi:uncharacterized repeat protein (TIGR01451 family)